jgi:hypothetical protein
LQQFVAQVVQRSPHAVRLQSFIFEGLRMRCAGQHQQDDSGGN